MGMKIDWNLNGVVLRCLRPTNVEARPVPKTCSSQTSTTVRRWKAGTSTEMASGRDKKPMSMSSRRERWYTISWNTDPKLTASVRINVWAASNICIPRHVWQTASTVCVAGHRIIDTIQAITLRRCSMERHVHSCGKGARGGRGEGSVT